MEAGDGARMWKQWTERAGTGRFAREVVASLKTDEALVLMMDAVSKLLREPVMGMG
jgi:hypothetical protein